MAYVKGRPTEPIPLHRILREVYRHYMEYKQLVASTGDDVIRHGYYIYEDDGETVKDKVTIEISFWDLHYGLKDLSPRKREAVFWNVIMDKKQKDVAEKMGITTVSVGQYVEQACIQLAKRYFAEDNDEQADQWSGLGRNGSGPDGAQSLQQDASAHLTHREMQRVG